MPNFDKKNEASADYEAGFDRAVEVLEAWAAGFLDPQCESAVRIRLTAADLRRNKPTILARKCLREVDA